MSRCCRSLVFAFLGFGAVSIAGCASTPGAPLAAGSEAVLDGVVASIDKTPWTYDGNAVIQLDTREHGRVAVQLPARWNLCAASPVDVEALATGMPVRVAGTVGVEGEIVVCQRATHRLVPAR